MPSNPLAKIWQHMRAFRMAVSRNVAQVYDERRRQLFPTVSFSDGVILKRPHRFFPGKGVAIHDRAYLNCAGGDWANTEGFIRTGDNVEIGPYAVLWRADGITLGNNVHVGDHVSVIAPGAVVIRDVPACTLVAGVPARAVRTLSSNELTDQTVADRGRALHHAIREPSAPK